MKNQIILPDTNAILRFLLRDHEEQFRLASELFEKVRTGGKAVIILESVLLELIHVLTKFYKAPKTEVSDTLCDLLSYKGIKNRDKNDLSKALKLYSQVNLDFVDCLLVVKSETPSLEVLTFDKVVKKRMKK